MEKYCHYPNVTACAIEFMEMVGADLHIRPKVESSHKSTRSAPQNDSIHGGTHQQFRVAFGASHGSPDIVYI